MPLFTKFMSGGKANQLTKPTYCSPNYSQEDTNQFLIPEMNWRILKCPAQRQRNKLIRAKTHTKISIFINHNQNKGWGNRIIDIVLDSCLWIILQDIRKPSSVLLKIHPLHGHSNNEYYRVIKWWNFKVICKTVSL